MSRSLVVRFVPLAGRCGYGFRLQQATPCSRGTSCVYACARNRVTQSCSGKKFPGLKPVSAALSCCPYRGGLSASGGDYCRSHNASCTLAPWEYLISAGACKRGKIETEAAIEDCGDRTSGDGKALSSAPRWYYLINLISKVACQRRARGRVPFASTSATTATNLGTTRFCGWSVCAVAVVSTELPPTSLTQIRLAGVST